MNKIPKGSELYIGVNKIADTKRDFPEWYIPQSSDFHPPIKERVLYNVEYVYMGDVIYKHPNFVK